MFENIKQDYYRSKARKGGVGRIIFKAFKDAGFRAVLLYRIGHWCRRKRLRLSAAFLERLMHHLCHCWISTLAEIGPGFIIAHVCGIIIPAQAIIGKNCDVRQNVTFGGSYGKCSEDGRTNPWVGDNVSIGAGAIVLGPVRIGSNSIIGANAVVTKSVPENSVVGAFRAEVLARCEIDTEPNIYNPSGIRIERPDKRMFLTRRELYRLVEELCKRVQSLEETIKQQNS